MILYGEKPIRPDIMTRVRSENLSIVNGVRLGVFTVPGDTKRCVDFAPVLKEAAQRNYSDWLVIEAAQDNAFRDPFHCQSMDVMALQTLSREVGLHTSRPGQQNRGILE